MVVLCDYLETCLLQVDVNFRVISRDQVFGVAADSLPMCVILCVLFSLSFHSTKIISAFTAKKR